MPVQPIRDPAGQVVGYQARIGAASKYFSVAKHGGAELAHALAARVERSLRRAAPPAPRRLLATNTSGINGLRTIWRASEGDGPPVLCVQVSWRHRGKPGGTHYSTERHGRIGATQLAIAAFERATRRPFGMTARQAWAVLSRRLEG